MTIRLYHFTSKQGYRGILEKGYIAIGDGNLSFMPSNDNQVVWLTTSPLPTGGHGLGGSAYDKTQVRFTLDLPEDYVSRWATWADRKGIDPEWKECLIATGGGKESADTWWVAEDPIPDCFWTEINLRDE